MWSSSYLPVGWIEQVGVTAELPAQADEVFGQGGLEVDLRRVEALAVGVVADHASGAVDHQRHVDVAQHFDLQLARLVPVEVEQVLVIVMRRLVHSGAIVAELTFADVPAGTYAVAVAHDEDEDLEVATGLFGIPREGVGGTWDGEQPAFGPPRFAQSTFELTADRTIEVAMMYIGRRNRRTDLSDCS